MLSQRSTPVKMSQEAARKLPRWSLLALLTIFAFSGFWATGLWTLRDALSFGTASAMLDGGASAWLMPMMADSPITEAGPLGGWLTAVIIGLRPPHWDSWRHRRGALRRVPSLRAHHGRPLVRHLAPRPTP